MVTSLWTEHQTSAEDAGDDIEQVVKMPPQRVLFTQVWGFSILGVFIFWFYALIFYFFWLVSIFWQMTIGADEWNEGSERLKENVSIHFPMSSLTTCPQIEMLWFSGNSLPRHLLCTDSVEASSGTYWYLYSQQHSRLCGDSTIPAKPHAVLFLLLCTRHTWITYRQPVYRNNVSPVCSKKTTLWQAGSNTRRLENNPALVSDF